MLVFAFDLVFCEIFTTTTSAYSLPVFKKYVYTAVPIKIYRDVA